MRHAVLTDLGAERRLAPLRSVGCEEAARSACGTLSLRTSAPNTASHRCAQLVVKRRRDPYAARCPYGPRRRTPPGTATRARAAGRSARPRAARPSARRSARTSAAARDATTGADGGRARRRRGGGRAREAEARFVRRRRSPSRDPDGATPGPRGVVGRSSSFGSGATAARRRRRDASASGSGSYITLYYITFHYINVYGTVQYSAVQYSTVQYSTVQYITLHSTPLHYSTVHYRAHRVGERVARRARER